MKTLEAIQKREDVSPADKKRALKEYGEDIPYADEKNKKYPLDKEHIHAAITYWARASNRAKYSAEDQKKIGARIRKYAKKWGVEIADDDKAESEAILIKGEVAWQLSSGSAPEKVLYMPAGDHTIFCRVNGEPKEISVHVTEAAAEALQSDLEKLLKEDVRPFIDFNHKGESAAATPLHFEWVDGEGIYLNLEWSRSGKENVEGEDFKHFSPTFCIDKDGFPSGLPESGPIGALVNNPAFREQKAILDQIAAELAAVRSPKPKPKTTMIIEAKGLKALAKELFGDEAPDDDDDQMPEKLLKKIKGLKKSLQEAEAKAKKAVDDSDEANAKKEEAEAELAGFRQQSAEQTVDAVIAAGKIPGKNQQTRKFYIEAFMRDPDGTRAVFASMGVRQALTPVVKVDGRERSARVEIEAAAPGASPEHQYMMRQRALIQQMKKQNPGLDTDAVLVLAQQEHPEAFVEG